MTCVKPKDTCMHPPSLTTCKQKTRKLTDLEVVGQVQRGAVADGAFGQKGERIPRALLNQLLNESPEREGRVVGRRRKGQSHDAVPVPRGLDELERKDLVLFAVGQSPAVMDKLGKDVATGFLAPSTEISVSAIPRGEKKEGKYARRTTYFMPMMARTRLSMLANSAWTNLPSVSCVSNLKGPLHLLQWKACSIS